MVFRPSGGIRRWGSYDHSEGRLPAEAIRHILFHHHVERQVWYRFDFLFEGQVIDQVDDARITSRTVLIKLIIFAPFVVHS